MASANPEEVEDEIVELLGCKREEVIRASGKTGMGVEEILAAVIERIPHPEGDEEATFNQLYWLRGIMGVSEALYLPAALSLIADFHKDKTRSLAVGIHISPHHE